MVNRRAFLSTAALASLLGCAPLGLAPFGFAQAPDPAKAAIAEASADTGKPKVLAPGVLTTIPRDLKYGETFIGPRGIVELLEGANKAELEWTPKLAGKTQTLQELAKKMVLRHPVWQLEFSFKPVRMINIDIPQPNGTVQRKLVWYMVYRVRDIGGHISPTPVREAPADAAGLPPGDDRDEKNSFEYRCRTDELNFPIRFFPKVVLKPHAKEIEKLKKVEIERQKILATLPPKEQAKIAPAVKPMDARLDQLIPVAIAKIREREDPAIPLYDSVEMTRISLNRVPDKTAWGVLTWADVEPTMNYFTITIQGLSNAYQYEDPAGAYKPGDKPGTGREFKYKTLTLNFSRMGDEYFLTEEEIRPGIAGDLDYYWSYE